MVGSEIKAIKAGRMIDGTGAAPVENVTILIENQKIKDIGPNIQVPPGAETIDATGKTVMPGLINAHMHCDGPKIDDTFMVKLSRAREVGLIKAVSDVRGYLEGGFTTLRSCGGTNGLHMKQAIIGGFVSGMPRLFASGLMLQSTIGSPFKYMAPEYLDGRSTKIIGSAGGEVVYCDGVDECIKAARYTMSRGSEFVKIWPRRGSMFNPEELKAISRTAAQMNTYVCVHTESSLDCKNSIEGGARTIEHAYGVEEEVVELANKSGAVFTSNLSCWTAIKQFGAEVGRDSHELELGRKRVELMVYGYNNIRKAGGTLALGDDSGGESLVQALGGSAAEMELLSKNCDFTPMEVIVIATKNGAITCGIDDKTGTLEKDKLADIIIVDGDPLADITILKDKNNIKMVMLEGKIEIDRS